MKKEEEKDEKEKALLSDCHPAAACFPSRNGCSKRPNGPDPRRAVMLFRCKCVCEFTAAARTAGVREKNRGEPILLC